MAQLGRADRHRPRRPVVDHDAGPVRQLPGAGNRIGSGGERSIELQVEIVLETGPGLGVAARSAEQARIEGHGLAIDRDHLAPADRRIGGGRVDGTAIEDHAGRRVGDAQPVAIRPDDQPPGALVAHPCADGLGARPVQADDATALDGGFAQLDRDDVGRRNRDFRHRDLLRTGHGARRGKQQDRKYPESLPKTLEHFFLLTLRPDRTDR